MRRVGAVIVAARVAPVGLSVALGTPEATPGSDLDLRVTCRAAEDVTITGVEVALVTTTTVRHREAGLLGSASRSRRTEVHAQGGLPGPWPLGAGESVTLPARLYLPADAPGTATADLVRVEWALRVRLAAVGFAFAEARRDLVVRTGAADRAAVATAPPTLVDRGSARLALEALSSRVLSPGGVVAGTLLIEPLRATHVSAARVTLLLRQQVHHGHWLSDDPARNPASEENEKDTKLAQATVCDARDLQPGSIVRLPFSLSVPADLPAPSMSRPEFTLRWLLRADLDRGLRRKPFVELELHGRTAPG
jgi:sporulation-control protein spo0M